VQAASDSLATPDPLPPAEQAVLDTVCGPQVYQQLGLADLVQMQAPLNEAESQLHVAAEADPRYLQALATWSSCLVSAGYHFDALLDASNAAAAMPGGDQGAQAKQLAVADYGCQRQARLNETARTIEVELAAAWVEAHPDALAELHAAIDKVTAAALAAVG
jgi:hypothetical protein